MGYRRQPGWFILIFVLLAGIIFEVFTGPGGFSLKNLSSVISFRLPRVGIGIIAGGVLAVVGGSFQGLLRNPLVDPWTLGVASGAALGATVAMISGTGSNLFLPVAAFLGALLAIGLVYILAGGKSGVAVTRLVLAGVIVSFFFSSLVMLLMVLGRHTLGEAVYLMMGNLGIVFTQKSGWLLLICALLALAGSFWLFVHARELDVISLDDEVALSLGVDAQKLTRMVFLVGSLAVGMVVAWTGAISFVGLVAPHLVRMLFGPKHRVVLPGSFLLGAGMLLLADSIVRNIAPAGLPLSVITALIGVPFFIYLLKAKV